MFRNAVPGAQLLHRSTNVNLCTHLKMYVRGYGRQPTFLANMMLHFYCLFFFFSLVLFCCLGLLVRLPCPSCSRSYTASMAFLFSSGLILLPHSFCSASLVSCSSGASLARLLSVLCYSCVSLAFYWIYLLVLP